MNIGNTVLLIDEDEVMHYLIQVILNKFKATGKSKSVSSCEQALKYLQENISENNFPKLIVVNLDSDNEKDIDFIKTIVKMKYYSPATTDIIVVTKDPSISMLNKLKALGVSQIFKKPELPESYNRLKL